MSDNTNFTFICDENGIWFLTLRTIDDLLAYWKEFDTFMEAQAKGVKETKEFGKGWNHCTAYQLLIGQKARSKFISFEEAAKEICVDVHVPQYQAISEGKIIYVNKKYGYDFGKKNHVQFVHRKKLEFPKKDKDLVKIEKFPLGNHYYVYVDDVQLRNGDQVKFNTYEAAESFVTEYLNKGAEK